MKFLKQYKEALSMELREHRSSFLVYMVLRLLVILVLILQIFNQNWENVFYALLTLLLLIVPSVVQMTFKIELPITLEIIILLFIFAAEILGEIDDFYLKYSNWDTMLHTMNGFLAAAIGYSLVDILNKSKKAKFELSPIFICIVAFSFSMTIGVIWEFFEFSMDTFFAMDTQKDTIIHTINSVSIDPSGAMTSISDIKNVMIDGQALNINGYLDIGLIDTMEDLFVNFIGAIIFSIFGFFYTKNQDKKNIAALFVPRQKSKERDYLEIVKKNEE